MKQLKSLALACLIGLTLTPAVFANNSPKVQKWDTFSKGIVHAMQSDNDGLRMSALQQISRYGENLEVDELVFDIVRIYRNSKDSQARILALSALSSMRNDWAMDFLKRSVRFEKDEHILALTRRVVNEYYAT